MMVSSLKELFKVMEIEGIDRKSGRIAREIALETWISDWIVDVETSQSVIKPVLDSEEEDFLKYYLAYQIGDKLMDDCISVNRSPRCVSIQIKALRR